MEESMVAYLQALSTNLMEESMVDYLEALSTNLV